MKSPQDDDYSRQINGIIIRVVIIIILASLWFVFNPLKSAKGEILTATTTPVEVIIPKPVINPITKPLIKPLPIALTSIDDLLATSTETAYESHILDCVAYLESGNNPKLVYFDVNNQYSYSTYQFQLPTLRDLYPNDSDAQLTAIAFDPVKSRAITRYLIFTKHQESRWYNTFKKIKAGDCPISI